VTENTLRRRSVQISQRLAVMLHHLASMVGGLKRAPGGVEEAHHKEAWGVFT